MILNLIILPKINLLTIVLYTAKLQIKNIVQSIKQKKNTAHHKFSKYGSRKHTSKHHNCIPVRHRKRGYPRGVVRISSQGGDDILAGL